MSLLVESIKIYNGRIYNIALHEARANQARAALWGINQKIDLRKHIIIPDTCKTGLVKCRVSYDTSIREITFVPYSVRQIKTLKIIETDEDLHYSYKWADRPQLDRLYGLRDDCDEIIIVQHGLVTDAYYYNLVFEKDGRYITPMTPLLAGVQRAHLLKIGKITPIEIGVSQIDEYNRIHLINALTPMGEIVVERSDVGGMK
jgi:4-amino-4-deoxychorismate lyase